MKTTYRGVCTALLAVLLTLFLSPAMAEGYGLFIAGTEVTSENCWNLSHLNGVLKGSNPVMYYNPQSKVLTMKNVQIQKWDLTQSLTKKSPTSRLRSTAFVTSMHKQQCLVLGLTEKRPSQVEDI